VWFVLLNKETFYCTSFYDFSAMILWPMENGRIVCQKYGCVMTMTTALMEKMNIRVSGKGHTATCSDICMSATGGDISVTCLIVDCNK